MDESNEHETGRKVYIQAATLLPVVVLCLHTYSVLPEPHISLALKRIIMIGLNTARSRPSEMDICMRDEC